MKVSKPVIIFGIVVLLLAAYIHFFTGKKKAPTPVPAVPPATSQVQTSKQQTAQVNVGTPQTTPARTALPEPAGVSGQAGVFPPGVKPDFEKLRVAWVRNPFLLPQMKEEKKKGIPPAVKLLGIFEKGNNRVAIIDHEIVREGDTVGDEKIYEIEKDKVILIRNNVKRTISLATIESVVREEEPKTKETEKGK